METWKKDGTRRDLSFNRQGEALPVRPPPLFRTRESLPREVICTTLVVNIHL